MNVKEVLELAHGTYSMRDDLANAHLKALQEVAELKARVKEPEEALRDIIDFNAGTEIQGTWPDKKAKAILGIKEQV